MPEKAILLAAAHLERRRQQTSGTDHPTPADLGPTETRTPGRQTAWPHRGDWLAAPLLAILVLLAVLAVLTVLFLGPRVAIGQGGEWYDRNPFDPPTIELRARSGVIICEEGPSVPSHIGTWKYHSCWHSVFEERGYCMNLAPIRGQEVGATFYCRPTVEAMDRFVNRKFQQ